MNHYPTSGIHMRSDSTDCRETKTYIFLNRKKFNKLSKKFKNNIHDNQYSVKRITWIGLTINITLTSFKFFVGIIWKSQAVVADAFHSLSDMVTDFAVLFGVRFWNVPADEEHPYGHHRIQTLTTIIIGIALLIVALAF